MLAMPLMRQLKFQTSTVAKKGAILVQKYLPSGTLPPWLMAYKAEIEFGLGAGTCAFSIYQQKKRMIGGRGT